MRKPTNVRRAAAPQPPDPGLTESGSVRELAAEEALEIRRQAWEVAVDADRKKDVFIAILAHELRNLLAPIGTATAILQLESVTPAAISSSTHIIERQTVSMRRLIDDLLDVARLRLGEFELRRSRCTVSGIVDRSVQGLRALVLARGHRFLVHLPAEPLYILADEMRMAQVLHNLVSNAAKYTDPGGEIEVRSWREHEEIVISVSDTGIGIPIAQRQAIFDMYSQAGQFESTRSEHGLGIGLYLVRRIVEAHGGSIEVRSHPHGQIGLQGSEFLVRLARDAECEPR